MSIGGSGCKEFIIFSMGRPLIYMLLPSSNSVQDKLVSGDEMIIESEVDLERKT